MYVISFEDETTPTEIVGPFDVFNDAESHLREVGYIEIREQSRWMSQFSSTEKYAYIRPVKKPGSRPPW